MRILRVALLVGALLVPALAAVPVAAADPVHVCHSAVHTDHCGTNPDDCPVWVTLGHPAFLCLMGPHP